MYDCLHARLSICQFNYYFSLDGCEEFETCIYTVFLTVQFFCVLTDLLYRYHFLLFVPILCIGTVFLYSYWSSVSVPFSHMRTDPLHRYYFLYSDIYCAYYLPWYYLTPYSYMLSPNTYLISLITDHLTPYCLPCDYHISGIMLANLYYIYNDLYFWYLCTPVISKPVLLLLVL